MGPKDVAEKLPVLCHLVLFGSDWHGTVQLCTEVLLRYIELPTS